MKIWKNHQLSAVNPTDVKTGDDIFLLMESASKSYQKLLIEHFRYQQMVEDRVIKEVYPSANKLSHDLDISQKTVHRFNKDLACVIFKRNRWKAGKQTSNLYKMSKIFYQYLKAFRRLGLFKVGIRFQERWEWIKKMWMDLGCDHDRFMNKVWSYSPLRKSKNYEQGSKKMSLGDFKKCPSSSNSLSLTLENCTDFVPFGKFKEMEEYLQKKIRLSIEDMRWYLKETGKTITNFAAFFGDAMSRHCSKNIGK
jgi:hypothetical protein